VRILYLGDVWRGGTALQRARALGDLDHEVTLVDTTQPTRGARGLFRRGSRKLFRHALDVVGVNALAVQKSLDGKYEVVWIDKGLTIGPKTILRIRRNSPSAAIVAYSPDDMAGSHNQSPRYLAAIPEYDVHVTTKSYNVAELTELGARRVVFVDNAYDPATHRPMRLSEDDLKRYAADVSFVGMYEADRACHIRELARRGIAIDIWGSGWGRNPFQHPLVRYRGRAAWGDEYAKILNATKINLCFLRKLSRDVQTTRSVEIPACQAFMLAERTAEHQRLFTEGVEAEYFGDVDELHAKCRAYLADDGARIRIARRAYERCLREGYSNQERLAKILHLVASDR